MRVRKSTKCHYLGRELRTRIGEAQTRGILAGTVGTEAQKYRTTNKNSDIANSNHCVTSKIAFKTRILNLLMTLLSLYLGIKLSKTYLSNQHTLCIIAVIF